MTTLPEEAVKAMPERIYAKVHGASTDVISGQRGLIGGWNEHHRDGQAEYVRADLYAALEAQLAEARKALGIMLREHDILSGNFGDVMDPKHRRPDRWPTAAEAARRALAGGQEDG